MAAGICAAGLVTSAVGQVTTTGFGSIPGVTAGSNPYSGSGIPFNTSEWTQISGIPGTSPDTLTLAMAATAHGSSNPSPGNNGAGTYSVNPGLVSGRSKWNFDFYINTALGNLGAYTFTLTELNVGNGQSFSFNPLLIPDNVGVSGSAGNSESLDFAQFGSPISYDPNQNDTYDFTLDAYNGNSLVGQDSITVVDGTGAQPVPDPASTAGLLGASMFGLACFAQRKQPRTQ